MPDGAAHTRQTFAYGFYLRRPWDSLTLSHSSPVSLAPAVWVTDTRAVVQQKQKKPLATAPGNGSHALTGTGACANGFILLTVTTTRSVYHRESAGINALTM